jgi:predicted enzyme related to lactoylglutathione lyase
VASVTHLPAARLKPHHPASNGVADNLDVTAQMNAMQISWVLAADDTGKLGRFYSDLFQARLIPGMANHHCLVQFGNGTRLEIYRPSRKRSFPTRGRALAPCLRLDPSLDPLPELQSLLSTALERGGSLLEEARVEAFGAEAWIKDPEGNPLLLLAPLASADSMS